MKAIGVGSAIPKNNISPKMTNKTSVDWVASTAANRPWLWRTRFVAMKNRIVAIMPELMATNKLLKTWELEGRPTVNKAHVASNIQSGKKYTYSIII